MTKVQRAILAAQTIGVIMMEYKAGELNRHGELIKSRVSRFLKRESKRDSKQFFEVVQIADKAWRDTINHFKDKHLKIETKSTILAYFNYFEDDLRLADIRNKHLEEWTKEMIEDAEIENNSYIVVDFMMSAAGIEKKDNGLKRRFTILNQNRIIEGKSDYKQKIGKIK